MDVEQKLNQIIPPNNYQGRHEFSNHRLIDKLTYVEKRSVEQALISKLLGEPNDMLIVETLAYMKSKKAIPVLKQTLDQCLNNVFKIIISASIYKIAPEEGVINIAIDSFKKIRDKSDLIGVFFFLKDFDNEIIDNMIKKHIDDSDFLVSYNAKRALGLLD